MKFPCISCKLDVRPRQQAVECDVCHMWQHRTCSTGITQTEYREAVLLGRLAFTCQDCNDRDETTKIYGEPPVLERTVPIDSLEAEDYCRDDEPPVLECSMPYEPESYDGMPTLERSSPVVADTELVDIAMPTLECSVADESDEDNTLEVLVSLLETQVQDDVNVLDDVVERDSTLAELHQDIHPDRGYLDATITTWEPAANSTALPEESSFRYANEGGFFRDEDEDQVYRAETIVDVSIEDGTAETPTLLESITSQIETDLNTATHDQLDDSFDMPHRNEDDAQEPVESSYHGGRELTDTVLEDEPVAFTVHEKGSKRGGRLLVSSDGFSYGVKLKSQSSTLWTCSVRSKKMRCHATVRQVGDQFVRGLNAHCHPGDIKLPVRVKVSAEAKKIASDEIFRAATDIVEEVELMIPEQFRFHKQKKALVKRAVNRHRANMRPAEPIDVNFEIDEEFIGENFLMADIREDGQRHVVLATAFQLDLLSRAKRWFIDGTFKVVHEPFRQLVSIHAFVQVDGKRKQFPLVFALMSRRQKTDYVHVLQAVLTRLVNPNLEEVVADFERAAWQAFREVVPEVSIKGCVFHWTQALWRQVQDLGLVVTYRERSAVYRYIGQLMALPFLPAAHIGPTFEMLRDKATSPALRQLVGYIDNQWLSSTIFPVASWSVYRYNVRTNNDVEGWHYRLNNKARAPGLTFYRLVPLLRREAELVAVGVMAGDLERDVRCHSNRLEKRLSRLWDTYMEGGMSTSLFLKTCASLYRHVFEK